MSKPDPKREFFIYALACPVTGEVRYVGKTVATVGVRMSSHRADARRGRDLHVYKWWRKVEREHGHEPVPVTLETGWGTTNHIAQRERAWIELHRSNGLRLTNLTDGGEGITGFAHSDETRRKISEAKKGVQQDPDVVARRAETNRGKKRTPEAIARVRAGRTYVAHGVAAREQMSASAIAKWNRRPMHQRTCVHCGLPFETRGSRTYCTDWCQRRTTRPPKDPADDGRRRPLTNEHKAKVADALRGRKTSQETRRKLSAANSGRVHSEKSRANMSAAHKGKFTKLSPELVTELRERYTGSYGEVAKLAREYAIDPSYLSKILKGKYH